jgi:Flp pilus assembly protein TadG
VRRLKTYFRRDEEAQGLIEFALLLTALSLIFVGVVDYSRFMYYQTSIQSAARVGAETASNNCYRLTGCTNLSQSTINSGIMQATECETSGASRLTWSPSIDCSNQSSDPCANCTTTTNWCSSTSLEPGGNVCVQRFAADCTTTQSTATVTDGQCVKITVGYNFHPISLLVGNIFSKHACWTGDTFKHQLCATAVGTVY